MISPKGQGLNIKAVAERTDVSVHTLRAWERRYGIPRPQRNAENRYRIYDDQDVADVLWMKRQIEAGVSPAQASALLRQQTAEMPVEIQRVATMPLGALQAALYDAFVERDDPAVQRILNEVWSAFTPEQVMLGILQPTLKQIGDAWQHNTLSVEQEHFASNLVRQRLHAVLQAQPLPAVSAPRLVAACAPDEQHDLGLLSFTMLAKRAGWNVNYLGQRTPLADMYHAGEGTRFIVVSVSTVTGLASLVQMWNQPLPSVPLLFGGAMFNLAPTLRIHIPGAFLGNDSVRAMQNLTTMTPRVAHWEPPRRLLTAALELEAERLKVAGDTVQQFMQQLPQMPVGPRNALQHSLSYAGFFLTDALVSALAFDAPSLMEMHGAWANEFMPAHQISMNALRHFVEAYGAVSAQRLPDGSANLIRQLLQRFSASLEIDAALESPEEL
jgi:MerR family transcriptional regulator, light-induced transcriptional regulator